MNYRVENRVCFLMFFYGIEFVDGFVGNVEFIIEYVVDCFFEMILYI